MSEKHWDISEKDAEFFAKLMGVAQPSDARPWHAQFLDVGWLVRKSATPADIAEEPPEYPFPDLDLLSRARVESGVPPDAPGKHENGGADLDWIASLQVQADSAGEMGAAQTGQPDDELEEPAAGGVGLTTQEEHDELERLLKALVAQEQQSGAEEKFPSDAAHSSRDADEKPADRAESAVPEQQAREEQSISLIGAGEMRGTAEEALQSPETPTESHQTAPFPQEQVSSSPEEESGAGPDEASMLQADAEEGTPHDLIGLEEVLEPTGKQVSGEAENRASDVAETAPDASVEGAGTDSAGLSALVPEEWTDFALDEEGLEVSGDAATPSEDLEPETAPERPQGEEVEEVIGASELNERVKVPWGDEVSGHADAEGDAFVELAVEQRIGRPGVFHRLALVDTDRRVGLEIGKHHVIYTIVVKRGSHFELEGYGIIPVETAESENEAVEQVGLQKVLEQIFSDRTLRQAYLAVADDRMETIIRRLELPRLSKKEMSEALRWALRKELPFDPDAAQIAHVFLSDKTTKQNRKVPVLAAAASKPEVEGTVQRLRMSGVRAGALVAPSWALYRLFTRFQESDPDTCQVLVHIGALRSEILFLQEGQLLFQRTITTALDDFVTALTSTLFEDGSRGSLSRREAFALLRKYGIPEMGASGRTDTGLRLTEVAVSVRPVVEKLVNEVERSLDYFRQKFKTQRFGRLWLSGIGATVLHLGGVLEAETRVPTQVFRPSETWPSFKVCKGLSPEILDKHGPALVIPLGLATGKPEPLNLLPARYRHSSVVRLAQRALAYGTLAGVVAAGMTTANVVYKTRVLRSDVVLLEQQRLRLVKQQAELRKLRNERDALQRELAAYLRQLPKGESVSLYLRALSRLTPPTMALTSVELVPPEETAKNPNVGATEGRPTTVLRIQGIVFPDPPHEGAHLAEFLLGLKQSGLFRSVRLENSRESDLPRVGLEFLAVGELR